MRYDANPWVPPKLARRTVDEFDPQFATRPIESFEQRPDGNVEILLVNETPRVAYDGRALFEMRRRRRECLERTRKPSHEDLRLPFAITGRHLFGEHPKQVRTSDEPAVSFGIRS
jgi:hypothetical protein